MSFTARRFIRSVRRILRSIRFPNRYDFDGRERLALVNVGINNMGTDQTDLTESNE
jgi:hypothetical protein